jgi:hypothetical protein
VYFVIFFLFFTGCGCGCRCGAFIWITCQTKNCLVVMKLPLVGVGTGAFNRLVTYINHVENYLC